MTKRVLIFDDDSSVRSEWRDHLSQVDGFDDEFKAETWETERFRDALAGLEKRLEDARGDGPDWEKGNPLDAVDILFIDYDLLTLYGDKFEVGENVAYLARCYSRCGLIVGVNQYGENEFDLTLRGHPESFADVNIGSKQIANRGLWNPRHEGGPGDTFMPWQWPHLPSALDAFNARRQELLDHPEVLDEPILSYLHFAGDTIEILSRRAIEFIQGGESFERTTFRDFVRNSGHGLHRKDKGDDVVFAQVAAARIWKWLERLVLSGQDVLVDAPHLVSRFPGLLDQEHISEVGTWNAGVNLFSPVIHRKCIEDFEFRKKNWLSRVAWMGRSIGESSLRDQLDPWNLEVPSFVFCEDRSVFRARGDAREFVADVPSAFVRRFVGDPLAEGVRYQPSVRFSV